MPFESTSDNLVALTQPATVLGERVGSAICWSLTPMVHRLNKLLFTPGLSLALKMTVSIVAISISFSANAQPSTMREAILIQGWLDKFDVINAQCQEFQKKNPALQVDVLRHFHDVKNACSATRYGQIPIPEEIQVENYKTLKAGRDCLVLIASELVKGGEDRIRIDATTGLKENEKQVLRTRLGEPIAETLQRCKVPFEKFDALRRSVRSAHGKGSLG